MYHSSPVRDEMNLVCRDVGNSRAFRHRVMALLLNFQYLSHNKVQSRLNSVSTANGSIS